MVRRNCKQKQNLACVKPADIKDKRNCSCCSRPVCDFRTCVATTNNSFCRRESSKPCEVGDDEGSNCRSSSTICKKEKKCVRPIKRVCKRSTIKKCKRNHDVCQNDIGDNVCKNSQDSCSPERDSTIEQICKKFTTECKRNLDVCQNGIGSNVCKNSQNSCLSARESTNEDNVCKNVSSEKAGIDDLDSCLKESPCKKFGCIEIDEAGVCINAPSVMEHIEECKKKFLGIIEASLCNIGKSHDPEKIMRSTIRAARKKEMERLMEGKTKDSDLSETSSKIQDEMEAVKKFCKDDLLLAAYEKLTTCGGDVKPEVCGPCGIENAVPCVAANDSAEKYEKCWNNAQGDYKDEEISEFVKIIDRKLREELTRKLKANLCAEDSVALKNSYYCVATLCPCMTKNYCMKGPLVLGPFNFAPQEEQPDVCCKKSDETESVCGSSSTLESFQYSNCIVDSDTLDSCDSANSVSVCSDGVCTTRIKCNRAESVRKSEKCAVRCPVVLEHRDSYVYCPDRRAEEHLDKAYSKKSEAVAKWGKCYDLVDSVLYERDKRRQNCKGLDLDIESLKDTKETTCKRNNGNEEEYLLTRVCGLDEPCIPKLQACKREDDDVCQNICSRPSHTCRVGYDGVCITGDDFDNLDRFHDIGSYGFAKLCRKLFKWVHCISKNWSDLRSNPHIVVHLPSLSFCNELRCRASKTFDYLQNAQVGRIGWLDDPNVQVIYIFPTPQSEELVTILQNLITAVRPDIDISKRLWMIWPEPKCVMKKCISGSANLFYSPDTYRRVRCLTAGRHAVILPGVMDQKDIFIGCELKIPIMGPPMKFQKRLLNKSHIMELLDGNNVQRPPFLHVHSFGQLCRGMAIMAFEYPCYKTWFVKIDNGFNGHHTAIIRFEKGILGSAIRNIERTGTINEDYLCKLLAETLPIQMKIQKSVYKNQKEFFCDLEQYGGIIQACPNKPYDVLSVGVFIEHDLAKPVFLTAAEVIHFGSDIRNDMAYFLPQNKILQRDLDKLVDTIGAILRNEHVVGYFGIDIVTFRDQSDVQQTWVIDVDPYYTDLIAFSDWVKFCVGPIKDCKPISKNFNEVLLKIERHAICCGKLFGTGLSKYCGSTLVTLCRQNHIFYNNEEKMGCMIYPTDNHNRALNIVSISTTRLLTMKKFIEALKVLNQLALRNNGGETFADTSSFSNYLKCI